VHSSSCPRPADGIQINQVSDGYVVYDPGRERIHYLNHTAVLLLELCNGKVAAGELPSLVQAAYDLAVTPVDEVTACLEQLAEEGLVR
jgi:hypothetical protein